jgi:hypothetical protein
VKFNNKILVLPLLLCLSAAVKGQSYFKKASATQNFSLRLMLPAAVQVDLSAATNKPSSTSGTGSQTNNSLVDNNLKTSELTATSSTEVVSNTDGSSSSTTSGGRPVTTATVERIQIITLSKA